VIRRFRRSTSLWTSLRQLPEGLLRARRASETAPVRKENPPPSAPAEDFAQRTCDLEPHAVTDPLTGLPNYRHVEQMMRDVVGPAILRDETHSILLMSIAELDRYVEQHGGEVGNAVLRECALRLEATVRRSDVLCRIDDRFFLLCRGATMAGAITVADQLQSMLAAEPVQVGVLSLPVTLRVGVATSPSRLEVRSAEELYRGANKALAHSSTPGRNGIVHIAMLPATDASTESGALASVEPA
jgi:diguanylate cyclase (GGDEF)-like protein